MRVLDLVHREVRLPEEMLGGINAAVGECDADARGDADLSAR